MLQRSFYFSSRFFSFSGDCAIDYIALYLQSMRDFKNHSSSFFFNIIWGYLQLSDFLILPRGWNPNSADILWNENWLHKFSGSNAEQNWGLERGECTGGCPRGCEAGLLICCKDHSSSKRNCLFHCPLEYLGVIYELCPAGFSETDIISESNEVGLWQTVLGQFISNDIIVHSIKKSFCFLFLLLNIK